MNAEFLAKQYLVENPYTDFIRPERMEDFLRAFDIFDDDLRDEVTYLVLDEVRKFYPPVQAFHSNNQ